MLGSPMQRARGIVCVRAALPCCGVRHASMLSRLAPVPGSTLNSTRVGRGPGNKSGKTSGRGTKGQNSRSGGGKALFEGGQTPIHIRLPKIGHNNSRRLDMTPVNLDRIQEAIDEGRLNPDVPITMKTLKDARIVNKIDDGVKLLARGKEMLKQPIKIYASRASKEAIQTIESAGGRFTAVYYNKLGLQYLVNPDNFGISKRKPRPALPVKRYLIDYYKDPMKRGFLSTPGINLAKLGLAPPSKVNAALPTMRMTDLVTRAHSAIMASEQKSKLRLELIRARKEYEQELKLAKVYGYLEGKNRIPKKLPLKR